PRPRRAGPALRSHRLSDLRPHRSVPRLTEHNLLRIVGSRCRRWPDNTGKSRGTFHAQEGGVVSAATVWLGERSESSERMADRVGMTVHEVKNLLALIQLSAWLMMRDSSQEEEARERFEVVRESCL